MTFCDERLANQTVQALWLKRSDPETRDKQYSATVTALVGISPKDEMEGMMAAQSNKLCRTYATLLEALNRHRGEGQQKVTV